MPRYSEAEREFRAEFTAQRDMLHKRIQRAISSGIDLTGTALDRFVTGTPGHYTEALPKLSEIDKEVARLGLTGSAAEAARMSKARVLQGKIGRVLQQETGSLSGIQRVEKQQKLFWESYGLDKLSEADTHIIGRALDLAKAFGLDAITYIEVMGAGQDMYLTDDKSRRRNYNEWDILRRAIMNKFMIDPRGRIAPAAKQATSLYINVMSDTNRQAERESAIKRLNNALRTYGGK